MVDLPIGIKVPISFTHATEIGPGVIERESRDLVRRTSDRPIGASSSGASVNTIVTIGENVALAHILRRAIALPLARWFVSDHDEVDEIARQDKASNAAHIVHAHRHRAFAVLEQRGKRGPLARSSDP